MTGQAAFDFLAAPHPPAADPAPTCRHCPRPARPGWLACPTCLIRRKCQPSWRCADNRHDHCTGTIERELGERRLLAGQPCGCECHATTFDPHQVDPDRQSPPHRATLTTLINELEDPAR